MLEMERPCEICGIEESIDIILYEGIYRAKNYLCEGCVDMYYYGKVFDMSGIDRIMTIKDYEFTNKLYCESCIFNKHALIEGKYIAYYENGARYLLCEGCSKSSIVTNGVKEMHLRN